MSRPVGAMQNALASRSGRIVEGHLLKLGVVGLGYGADVLVPAFRSDPRVEVVAIAGRVAARVQAVARELGIGQAYSDWRVMVDRDVIDAVTVAVPPWAQREICEFAFLHDVHVFAEKPLASTLADAEEMARSANRSSCANVVDFNFREIAAFREAEEKLRAGAIGSMRHIAVTWQVESHSNRARLLNWKSDKNAGGGALFNFVSHSLNYLEGFAGKIVGLSARLAGLPGDPRPNDSFVSMAFAFANGAAGSLVMSAAAFRGSGHRIDIHGEDGTIVLVNDTPDYMRGFRLLLARRPSNLEEVGTVASEADAWDDGRVLPVSRLARRFINWTEGGTRVVSDFAAGLRVQELLEAARLSHRTGAWIDVAPGYEFSIGTPSSCESPASTDKRI